MNGAHDLGGMDGFDSVDQSQQEHFPEQWERQVFALTLACGLQGKWNLDQSRFARESMEPSHYLSSSYYEHWLHGLEKMLLDAMLVTEQELASGAAEHGARFQPIAASAVEGILRKGGPVSMPDQGDPKYVIGDRVVLHNNHPKHHTRMPRYVRGRSGEVVHHHGSHIFPDQHALDGKKVATHLYTVVFSAAELWGANDAVDNNNVFVDVFEPYIRSKV